LSEEGLSRREIAEKLEVSRSQVGRYLDEDLDAHEPTQFDLLRGEIDRYERVRLKIDDLATENIEGFQAIGLQDRVRGGPKHNQRALAEATLQGCGPDADNYWERESYEWLQSQVAEAKADQRHYSRLQQDGAHCFSKCQKLLRRFDDLEKALREAQVEPGLVAPKLAAMREEAGQLRIDLRVATGRMVKTLHPAHRELVTEDWLPNVVALRR
jgi:hypothetical protein